MKKRVLSLIVAVLLCVQMMPAMVMAAAENTNVDVSSEKLPFTDVKPGDWFYDSVDYVYQQEIMTGMTTTYFGAVEKLARAQFAAVLYRMAGEPEVDEKQVFPDVPVNTETEWYAKAVNWANENKIILGYENGRFGPADPITREQMVVMMYRYAQHCGYDTGTKADFSNYPDASKVSAWAKDAMEWAVGTGIITGDKGKINPQGKVSRAVCATIIQRYDNTHKDAAALVEEAIALIDAEKYEEALVPLLEAVEMGDAAAQNLLGDCYCFGYGVEESDEEAVKYYRLAADQGYALAQFNLGVCYDFGYGVEQNFEEAVKYYRLAADQGLADAQYYLGVCYYYGEGVEQNFEEAVKYYQLAADQGLADAQYNLGVCYDFGNGVERNDEEAVKYYRLAADQEYGLAQCNLGYCYYYGTGVERDYEEALKYFYLAADQGVPNAMFGIGECYYTGSGVEKDLEEAAKWYQKALDAGYETMDEEEMEHLAAVLGEGYDIK